ncbi:cytochrome P450 3A19-like [Convolutriloba macropyga]|uniref:cytochrome P450 3A19-like n=1 Tax=Convolutriloba macropyga TaxID=536237 RepID=UPI003F528B0E
MFSNPLTVLSLFVPGVGKIVKLFDPSLGLNLEASEVTAKFMLEIMKKKNETQTLEEKTFFLNTLVEKFELHQVTQGKDGIDFESTVAQALIFLLAGFDTTANLLMWTSYYLALHPDVQDQVFEEITSHAGLDGEEANYETVNKMHLLENVLMETLRLRPVFRTQREAVADTTIGPGINIKKGWLVEVAVNVIHNDPKIWGDPEVFRPSRFDPEETKERSPYAFNAFGVGPRNCIGMRLALFEVKMAFVKILSKYKLMRGRDTPDTFTNYLKQQFYDPVEPIFLKVARRH